MAATILSIVGIRKSFGSLHALDGVSLDVEEGKISILIGPNGSGKTTLINVISGLYKPDSGRTFFKGQDITSLAPYELYDKGLARTFQIPALFWKLTVLENLLVAEKDQPGERFIKSILPSGLASWKELRTPLWESSEVHAVEKARLSARPPVSGLAALLQMPRGTGAPSRPRSSTLACHRARG